MTAATPNHQAKENHVMISQGQTLGYAGVASGSAPIAPPQSLSERLVFFIENTRQVEAMLASSRDRLCGPWPQTAQGSNANSAGQVDGLLDALQSVLADVFDHAAALNSRI